MHVYKLMLCDDFESYNCRRRADNRRLRQLDDDEQMGDGWRAAAPILPMWLPIELEVYVDEERRPRKRPLTVPDFTIFGSLLVFSKRAATALAPILTAEVGEFLPLYCKNRELVGFRAFPEIDAIDLKMSVSAAAGAIFGFDHYAFVAEKIGRRAVFRAVQEPYSHFVTDQFVRTVVSAGLVGFDFRPISFVDRFRPGGKSVFSADELPIWSAPGSDPPPEIPPHLSPKPPRQSKPRLAPALGDTPDTMTGREPMLGEASRSKARRKRSK